MRGFTVLDISLNLDGSKRQHIEPVKKIQNLLPRERQLSHDFYASL